MFDPELEIELTEECLGCGDFIPAGSNCPYCDADKEELTFEPINKPVNIGECPECHGLIELNRPCPWCADFELQPLIDDTWLDF